MKLQDADEEHPRALGCLQHQPIAEAQAQEFADLIANKDIKRTWAAD